MLTGNSSQQHPLLGRTAVVTGASSGVGRAIAMRLAQSGADVLIHARRSRAAAEEVAELIRRTGRQSEVQLCDLADADQHDSFCRACWSWRDGVDVWVNNAGADVLTGEAANWSFAEKLNRLWQVDVCGAVALSRWIGKRMLDEGAVGRDRNIINVGWDQAAHGMAGDSGEMFSAIKAAVMAFSKSLARSLAPRVRVNCLAPGWIKTSWGGQASEYWQQRARRESLLDRWGEPEDVARAANFLASPEASFITGQIVNVNGGFRHQDAGNP